MKYKLMVDLKKGYLKSFFSSILCSPPKTAHSHLFSSVWVSVMSTMPNCHSEVFGKMLAMVQKYMVCLLHLPGE